MQQNTWPMVSGTRAWLVVSNMSQMKRIPWSVSVVADVTLTLSLRSALLWNWRRNAEFSWQFLIKMEQYVATKFGFLFWCMVEDFFYDTWMICVCVCFLCFFVFSVFCCINCLDRHIPSWSILKSRRCTDLKVTHKWNNPKNHFLVFAGREDGARRNGFEECGNYDSLCANLGYGQRCQWSLRSLAPPRD